MAVNCSLKLLSWLPGGTVGFVFEGDLFLPLGVDASSQLKAQLGCLLSKPESSLHPGDLTGREFLGGRWYPPTPNVPREAEGVKIVTPSLWNYTELLLMLSLGFSSDNDSDEGTWAPRFSGGEFKKSGSQDHAHPGLHRLWFSFSMSLPLSSFIVLKTLSSSLRSPSSKGHISSFYILLVT